MQSYNYRMFLADKLDINTDAYAYYYSNSLIAIISNISNTTTA